jgi:integrase
MARDTVTLEKKPVIRDGKTYRYWVLRWVDPQTGKRRSRSLGKMKDIPSRTAKIQRDLFQAQLFSNPSRRSHGMPLQGFTDQYVLDRIAEGKSPATIILDKRAIDLLTAHFGPSKPIDEITKADARRFWTALLSDEFHHVHQGKQKPGMKQETAKKHMRSIRAMFNRADEDDIIDGNPFRVIKGVDSGERLWRYITMPEFWRLYRSAKAGVNALLALARLASIGRSDALSLTWTNVDMQKREISFQRQKTGIQQTSPICDELMQLITEWPQGVSNDKVIADTYTGNLGRDIKVVCKRAGVEAYKDPTHSLRKSCITDWAAVHPPHVVRVWAGHSSVKTTLTFYAKMRDEDMDKGKQPMGMPEIFTPKTTPTGEKHDEKI